MMSGRRVVLKGGSRAFTGAFRRALEDCGFDSAVEKRGGPRLPIKKGDIVIAEVRDGGELSRLLRKRGAARPYLIFTGIHLNAEDLSRLKRGGLAGVIRKETAPEEIASLVNQAFLHNGIVKRNARAQVAIPVTVKAGGREIKGFTSALSRDGMFIVALNPLPPDSITEVSFSLPETGRAFSAMARVLYNIGINKDLSIIASPGDPFKRLVTHPGMAVFFLDLTDEEREAVERFVMALA